MLYDSLKNIKFQKSYDKSKKMKKSQNFAY